MKWKSIYLYIYKYIFNLHAFNFGGIGHTAVTCTRVYLARQTKKIKLVTEVGKFSQDINNWNSIWDILVSSVKISVEELSIYSWLYREIRMKTSDTKILSTVLSTHSSLIPVTCTSLRFWTSA
ncbi:uncharacterized protein ACNLHF_008773 isoform 2-T2 [Anomaloglossus baeobatrachus]